MNSKTVRGAALALVLACATLAAVLPLAVAGSGRSFAGALALAGSVVIVQALTFAPVLLPGALVLYAGELVIAAHEREIPLWSVAPLAAVLLLLYETADLRERLPNAAHVERRALRSLMRQMTATVALGLSGAAVTLAAATLPSEGGVTAGIAGGTAVAAAALLTGRLGRL